MDAFDETPEPAAPRTVRAADEAADHYTLLGVARDAGHEQIRTAVAHQLRRWNARASGSPTLEARQRAESRVARLNRARRELLDPDLRAAYDQRLTAGETGGHAVVQRELREQSTPPPRTVLRREPQPAASAWLDRAWKSVEDKRYEDGLYEARKATGESPRNHNAWLLLGWLRWKTRDLEGARLAYRTCISLAPGDPRPHMELGDVLRHGGALGPARAEYLRATELGPDTAEYRQAVEDTDLDILRRGRADTLYEQSRHRDALEVYLTLLDRCYGDSELHNQVGRCMSIVANSFRHYPADGSLPYIPNRKSAEGVKEWAQAALSYELTDERLVKKLREDIHFADMVLDSPTEGRP